MRVAALAIALLSLLPAAATSGPRYDLAGRCVALTGADGGPFYFKATGFGTYLIQDRKGQLLTPEGRTDTPGPSAEWSATRTGRRAVALRSTQNSDALEAGERFTFAKRRRCRPFPEAGLGARGKIAKAKRRDGTVFGYADAHLHVVSDLRAGGRVISGESFNRFGITQALGKDAEVHGADGSMDITGNLLRSGEPTGTHDTEGWPSFAGWPVYDTYTHQQVYYMWLKRAYMAGLRMVTAQLVEDEALCNIEPQKSHSCDETETIELEAKRMQELEDYVDAQSGGPGKGWFRIVDHPREARRAIARGKLAVLMGVESSSPFGCSELQGLPQCTEDDIDRGIALYKELEISTMFIAHWVDNAFGGAALEEGDRGTFIASFQLATTGHPFATGPCPQPEQGETCNQKGLTELGEYLVNRLMDNHMLIEMDHLSEVARERVLQIAEERDYPLVSSHTNTGGIWTRSDLERLYKIGGFATARPDTAQKLANTILSFRRYSQPGQVFGVGIGTDTGGFSAAPEPDPEAKAKPLKYPFRSNGGKVKFNCPITGTRKFDFNRDGVAQYGLYADLLAYMRTKKGGRKATALLFKSAEAYLRTWERAQG